LEGLSESQHRIEAAVTGIESAQMVMSSTLQTVQSVSMATLGLTSLTTACMFWRLKAIDTRLKRLQTQIGDVEVQLEAGQASLLDSSLNYLQAYDQRHDRDDLRFALDKARESANTYGRMTDVEIEGKMRVPVLNYRGRRFLLSLMTELHCLLAREHVQEANDRVAREKSRLQQLVASTYRQTLAKAPEVYLHPKMAQVGVTLASLTDLYQQLKLAGVLNDMELRDAAAIFEHLREPIYRQGPFSRLFLPGGKATQGFARSLRYLIACVEDVNRLQAMHLLMGEALKGAFTFADLRQRVAEWRKELATKATNPDQVFAYRFI